MTALDWSIYPNPWRAAGPRFARAVQAIIEGKPADMKAAVEVIYRCPDCEYRSPSRYSLNAHRRAHKRARRRAR